MLSCKGLVLTNQIKTKWLLNENYVEKIYNLSIFQNCPKNFVGQLFSSAAVPVCIAYFQKNPPQKTSNTIEYLAPKTYIKSNLIDGVVIDSTDIKFLPRTECQMPDTKIWKIAMWGNIVDYYFLKCLCSLGRKTELLQSKDLNLADFIPCYVSSHEKFLSMKHLMFDFTK